MDDVDELDQVAEIKQLRAALPEGLREQVERALLSGERLEREANRLWREYGLRAYGIRREVFRAYAVRLQWMARQRAAGVIAASLSSAQRGAGAATGEASVRATRRLLAQRLVESLQHGGLATAELAQLAQAVAALQRSGKRAARVRRPRADAVGELVRDVYGVSEERPGSE